MGFAGPLARCAELRAGKDGGGRLSSSSSSSSWLGFPSGVPKVKDGTGGRTPFAAGFAFGVASPSSGSGDVGLATAMDVGFSFSFVFLETSTAFSSSL